MPERGLTVVVTGDLRGLSRALKGAQAQVGVFGKNTERNLDRVNSAFGGFNNSAWMVQNTIKAIKPAALIAGLGMLASAAGAAAAGGVALVAALAPLAGALATYPTLASAGAQAMGTFKLATLGLSDALDDVGKALSEPTPRVKAFAAELGKFVPRLERLRDVAQRPVLRGMSQGLQSAARNFGRLTPIVRQTGQEIGALAARAGRLVGGRGFGADLARVGRSNTVIIRRLGNAAIDVADALRHVVVAAGPLTRWLSQLARGWAASLRSQARAGRESGRMAAFFEQTRAVISRLLSIGGSLATTFWNIGKAAAPLGRDVLRALDRGAAAMARWTKSAEGQRKLADWFEQMRPAVFELGRLVRDVAGAFLRLSTSADVAPILRQVRTELLPVFEEVVSATTRSFGPTLIDALVNITRLFGALAGTSGPLTVFVQTIGKAAGALADLLQNNPALQTMVVTIGGAAGVLKAMRFGAAITGLSTLSRGFRDVAGAAKAARAAQAGAAGATAAGGAAAAAGGGAAAAAGGAKKGQGALAALGGTLGRLPPQAMAVVAAVAAIGAGLVLLYKKSETFRRFLQGAFEAVKRAGAQVAATLGPALKSLGSAFVELGRAALPIVRAIGNVLRAVFEGVVLPVARRVFDGLLQVVRGALNTIAGVVKFFASILRGDFSGAWNAVKQVFRGALNGIVGMLKAFTAPFRVAAGLIGKGVLAVLRAAWNGIKAVIGGAMRAALAVLKTLTAPFRGAARALGQAVLRGIQLVSQVVGRVRGWIGGAVRAIASVVGRAAAAARNVAGAIMRGIGRVASVVGRVAGVMGDVVGKIGGFIGKAAGKAAELGKGIIGGIVNGAKAVFSKLAGLATDIANAIISKVKSVLGISSPSTEFRSIGDALFQGLKTSLLNPAAVGDIIVKVFGGMRKLAARLAKAGLLDLPTALSRKLGDYLFAGGGVEDAVDRVRRAQERARAGKRAGERAGRRGKTVADGIASAARSPAGTAIRQAQALGDAVRQLQFLQNTLDAVGDRTDAAGKKFIRAIEGKIASLNRFIARRSAIGQLRDSLRDLAEQAGATFRAARELAIDTELRNFLASFDPRQAARYGQALDSAGSELRALQQAEQDAARAAEDRQNAQARAEAQTRVDRLLQAGVTSGRSLTEAQQALADAQAQIESTARQRRMEALEADIADRQQAAQDHAEDQKSLLDGQTATYVAGLNDQLQALVGNLNSRTLAYATFVEQVNGLLAGAGVAGIVVDPELGIALDPPSRASSPKRSRRRRRRRASGGTASMFGELARLDEFGTELVRLPGGARVTPAAQSRPGAPYVYAPIDARGTALNERQIAEQIGREVARKAGG